jgi:hypothetical protein
MVAGICKCLGKDKLDDFIIFYHQDSVIGHIIVSAKNKPVFASSFSECQKITKEWFKARQQFCIIFYCRSRIGSSAVKKGEANPAPCWASISKHFLIQKVPVKGINRRWKGQIRTGSIRLVIFR